MLDPDKLDLTHAHVYVESRRLKKSVPDAAAQKLFGGGILAEMGKALFSRYSHYFRISIPAKYSPTGRAIRGCVRETPEIRRLANEQILERERRRKAQALVPGRKWGRGRPPDHADGKLLASIGAYRRGKRIHFSRKVSLEDRARARYRLLEPEWQQRLSEEQFIEVERHVRYLRKRANRFSLKWDEEQAYDQAVETVLGESSRP